MAEPVIVEAVRTPIGKRNGWLSGLTATETAGATPSSQVVERAGIDPGDVEQVIGGCVTQAGEQASNVTRNAWLSAGPPLPFTTACTTVDCQCGSAQQANHLIAGLIAAGGIDVGIALRRRADEPRAARGQRLQRRRRHYKTEPWPYDDPPNGQFGAAERIAEQARHHPGGPRRARASQSQQQGGPGLGRGPLRPRDRPVEAPVARRRRQAHRRDAAIVDPRPGPARHHAGGLAKLKPVTGGRHAHRRHVVADLRRRRRRAVDGRRDGRRLGACAHGPASSHQPGRHRPLLPARRPGRRHPASARPVAGHDDRRLRPLRDQRGLRLRRACRGRRCTTPDLDKVNVNGGAIALGHPVGSTGAGLITTALHELERTDGELALVTMCCGGALGIAAVLERLA